MCIFLASLRRRSQRSKRLRLLLLLAFVVSCHAEQIRIRVINSKTGRPVSSVCVQTDLLGGAGLRPGEPVEGSRRSNTTDKNGNATFSITLQHPYLVASFQQKCASEVSFSIKTILTQGIVAKNHCWHKNSELKTLRPHPGELVVFFDKLNVFEKWKHIRDAPGIP